MGEGLQAMCSYLEAEASVLALKKSSQPLVFPMASDDHEPCIDPDTNLRLPPQSHHQLQRLVVAAISTGMRLAHACQQAWAVVNGGVYAWNAFLPSIRAGRWVPSNLICPLFPGKAIHRKFYLMPTRREMHVHASVF
jgi:hypothetical protein